MDDSSLIIVVNRFFYFVQHNKMSSLDNNYYSLPRDCYYSEATVYKGRSTRVYIIPINLFYDSVKDEPGKAL